jgi:hypothetical protein
MSQKPANDPIKDQHTISYQRHRNGNRAGSGYYDRLGIFSGFQYILKIEFPTRTIDLILLSGSK